MTSYHFNLHPIKSVTLNDSKTVITFETLFVNGHVYYFTMNKNEFLNFDEALYLISTDNFQGNIPIGDNMWFSFFRKQDGYEIRLCQQRKDRFLYFDFDYDSFQEYKKAIHWKLFSFLRLKATEHDDQRERQKDNRYRSQHVKSVHGKRPLSDETTRSYQFTRNGETCERESSPGTTNDVNMSPVDETSTVFSKWCDSTSGRKDNSFDNGESDFDDLQSPEAVQLLDKSLSIEVDM